MSRRHELLVNTPAWKMRRFARSVNEAGKGLELHELARMRTAADPVAGVVRALDLLDGSPRCTLFQQTYVEMRVRLAVRHAILPGDLPSLDALRVTQAAAILHALGFDAHDIHPGCPAIRTPRTG